MNSLAYQVIDGLPDRVAMLNEDGVIVAANRAWNQFRASLPHSAGQGPGIGENYIVACEQVIGDCSAETRAFAAGIRAVIAGQIPRFEMELPGHANSGPEWCLARAISITHEDANYVTVILTDITAQKRTEGSIWEHQQAARSIYDSAPMLMGILQLFPNGQIHISGNPAAVRFFGAAPVDSPHEGATGLSVPQELMTSWIPHCHDSARTGAPVRCVCRCAVGDRSRSLAIITKLIAREADGLLRFSYVAEDVTERRQVADALRKSEARLEEAQRIAGVGSWEFEVATRKVSWSRELFFLLGMDPKRGHPTYSEHSALYMPEDIQRMNRLLANAIRTGKGYSLDLRRPQPDGSLRWFHAIANTVKDDSGKVIRLSGTLLDITERKQAEAALRTSEARLEEAQSIAGVGSWEFEIATRKFSWSKELFRLVDRDPAKGEPTYEEGLTTYLPEDGQRLNRMVVRAIRTGLGYNIDIRRLLPDGSTRWYQAVANTVKDQNGKVVRLAGTYLDITERKMAEQEMARLHESLRRAREQETAISARVQNMLLAPSIPENLHGVQIATLSLPSQLVDGDFSDFIVHSPTEFDLIIGDVMGKGLGTALLGAAAKSLFLRSLIVQTDSSSWAGKPSPEAVVRQVHRVLTPRLIELESFITAIFVRFDLVNQSALLVDCGHTNTIHYQAVADRYRFLQGDNLPLGVQTEERYRQCRIPIAAGDLFVFYSDGITEAQTPGGEMYGEDRLMELLSSHRYLSPEALIAHLKQSLQEFTRASGFGDDVTCIVVRIDGA